MHHIATAVIYSLGFWGFVLVFVKNADLFILTANETIIKVLCAKGNYKYISGKDEQFFKVILQLNVMIFLIQIPS